MPAPAGSLYHREPTLPHYTLGEEGQKTETKRSEESTVRQNGGVPLLTLLCLVWA